MGIELVGSPQELWKFGTQERTARGTPVVLVADVTNGAAETRYSALREPGAAAGYQVTAGRTLIITKLRYWASLVNTQWVVGSGTADAGVSQVAAPAGAVSEDSRATGTPNAHVTQAANLVSESDVFITIASGLFPFARGLTASTTLIVLAFGVEV